MRYFRLIFAFALGVAATARGDSEADVCVYGGTASGVVAAVQAARMGRRAVLVEPGRHLGGMTTGGLGATDIGNKAAIGGLARVFYRSLGRSYGQAEAWLFEPHVAENAMNEMVRHPGVQVIFGQRLKTVRRDGAVIREIETDDGARHRALMFIDASYEGDLLAKAGVSYVVGREANARYGETLDGVRAETPKHQFAVRVDPYREPGHPESGLLRFIHSGAGGIPGSDDHHVQAYNFRLCFTTNAANRLPIDRPANYDPADFELLARYLQGVEATGRHPKLGEFWSLTWLPNGKTDINNNGGFSTDFIGRSDEYPEADAATRARIWRDHENYTRGFCYFLANDPRVPQNIREEINRFGPCKDEFADTAGWPRQLYIREARRMVTDYVMTEWHCRGAVVAPDPAGLAAYTMDSHNCQRVVKNGAVENEGDVQVPAMKPYPVSYRAIVPRKTECENLFAPVCLAASHIAFGSIRMEPVFMILGQSSATAACLAIEERRPVQEIDYPRLRARLLADGQILEWPPPEAAQIK